MAFPVHRLRRLRYKETLRRMVRETRLSVDDLIYPLFVVGEDNIKSPMSEIPGCYFLSGDYLIEEAKEVSRLGIPAVLLFGLPSEREKDKNASMAYSPEGATQKAVRKLKSALPQLTVITDVCLCEYTIDGHCGVIRGDQIDNDLTLEIIEKTALSLAEAGSDVLAPSGMMDGVVQAIRTALDDSNYHQTLTMPYSAKFASKFYGPFKEGTKSKPKIGKHSTHQIDVANGVEALREVGFDIEEGADIVIVKPALTCLDIICSVKREFTIPVAAYNVSGEYTMILAASEKNLIDAEDAMLETLTCIKRAGADMVITYFAKEAARLLGEQ
ncbi:MAG: porphobilinogen synthase [Deltaproteobacteria bacterium]|nr:porphobilinogen synthase [Deltaproteobacteria bacterium]